MGRGKVSPHDYHDPVDGYSSYSTWWPVAFAYLILSLREGESGSQRHRRHHTNVAGERLQAPPGVARRGHDRTLTGGYVSYRVSGRVPYLRIDAVCTSLDAQAVERKSLLDSAQQASAVHAA